MRETLFSSVRGLKRLEKLLENFAKQIISLVEKDPERDGLKDTPERVAQAYTEFLSGYGEDPSGVIKLFDSNGFHDLITVANIEFYSLCEHHMIPFFGKIHIGYVPDEKILGISKFARIVKIYSRRLQTQEYLTKQIFDTLEKNLTPKGIILCIEAKHLCMSMRGIKARGCLIKTMIKNGIFLKRADLIDQFFRDIGSGENSWH